MSNSNIENERRHYQRIPFIANVLVKHNGQEWSCGLLDISLKGLLIEAPEAVDPLKAESYEIELVLGEAAAIYMSAQITHIKDSLWGLQWDNIDLEGLTHLRRLLELNMSDPEEMHRELAELG